MNSYLAYCYFPDKPHTFLIDFVDVLDSELFWPKRQSPSPNFEEMFPSMNSKGSGRCKVVGPNGKQCGAEAYYFCRKCSILAILHVWGPYCETVWLQASTIFSSTECSGRVTSSNYCCVSCFLLYGEFELICTCFSLSTIKMHRSRYLICLRKAL